MQVVAVAVASVAVHCIAAVQEQDFGVASVFWMVPVSATLPVASSAVRPSVVAAFVAAADMAVPAVVAEMLAPVVVVVVPVPVVAARDLPSVRRDCPGSSPFSVPPPSRQSSSGLAAWRKGVPARVR